MKILQLISTLNYGGAEKFCVELSNELSEDNEIIICTFRQEKDSINKKKMQKIIKYINFGIKGKHSINNITKIINLISKTNPDIVHINSGFITFYFIIVRLFFRKLIIIQTVHNTLTEGYKKQLNVLNYLFHSVINVTISDKIYNSMSAHYPSLYFYNIDNGISELTTTSKLEEAKEEIISYKETGSTKVFTAIGNYSDFKNFGMLAELFKELNNRDVILLIIGNDKDPKKKNYNQVKEIKGNNTFILGNKENVADFLYCSDCLISSSLQEGMPLTILEAFSMGIPVVATPAGGVVDMVIDGENGFLAKGFEKEDLRYAVFRFLNAPPEEIAQMKKNNLKRYKENYSMKTCAKKYELLYKEILASNKTNKTNRR